MSVPYHRPSDVDEFDDGCLTAEGGLAWTDSETYGWTESEGWISLSAPSAITGGFATPTGIIVGTEDDALGFWGFGARDWS